MIFDRQVFETTYPHALADLDIREALDHLEAEEDARAADVRFPPGIQVVAKKMRDQRISAALEIVQDRATQLQHAEESRLAAIAAELAAEEARIAAIAAAAAAAQQAAEEARVTAELATADTIALDIPPEISEEVSRETTSSDAPDESNKSRKRKRSL